MTDVGFHDISQDPLHLDVLCVEEEFRKLAGWITGCGTFSLWYLHPRTQDVWSYKSGPYVPKGPCTQ